MALLYTSDAAIGSDNRSTSLPPPTRKVSTVPPASVQTSPQSPVQSWSSITPEQLNPLLTRQFISGQQAMLARIVLRKGCVVPEHSHPNEQLAFVLEGALEFNLRGETHTVRTGEVLVIPAGVPHSAIALEDTIDFDVFAPPRADWIRGDDAYLRAPQTSDR